VEPDAITKMSVVCPNMPTQRAIADYLDHETARIDALVEKKQRVIDLLFQRRSETIRTLVRSGIVQVATVTASLPWIGEVPAHWDLLPLRRVGKLIAGAPFPDSFQGTANEELPYFKVADFETAANSEYMAAASNTVSRLTATSLGSPVIPAGSVVFPKIGAALLSNRRRITRVDACMDQNVMALVVKKGNARFFFYLLQTFDFGRLRMPGPIPLFNEGDAASLVVPVPPMDEQEAICRRLDAELPRLAVAAEKEVACMQLLQEKRQAVITAAVTGLISISGAA
jgi:type I restriction enzyme S subunit